MPSNLDFNNSVSVAYTIPPAVRTDGVVTGTTVDRAGYHSAMFIAAIGTLTDGTHAFDPEESDDDSTWTNIAAGNLSGAFVSGTSSADDRIQEIGYLGSKRYIRCNVAATGCTSGGPICVLVVRADPSTKPV